MTELMRPDFGPGDGEGRTPHSDPGGSGGPRRAFVVTFVVVGLSFGFVLLLNWQHVVRPSGEMFSGLGFLFAWLLVIVLGSVIAGIALGHRRSGSDALAGYAAIALAIVAFEAVLAVVAGPGFNNPQGEGFISAAVLGAVVSALFYFPAAACGALVGGAARRT